VRRADRGLQLSECFEAALGERVRGGGAALHEIKNTERGPYAQKVYGFTHLQVNREKFTVRHLNAERKQVHAFSKTLDGKIAILG